MRRFLLLLFAASCLATAPRCAAAQEGGALMQTTARTQFLLQDGEVVRREGDQITPLTQNVKLANGTKINHKNGIVEMPAVFVDSEGKKLEVPLCKKLTLHEGDFVRPDGSMVFATPASAAAAQCGPPVAPDAKYEKYTLHGLGYAAPAVQLPLVTKQAELLKQKLSLVCQGRKDLPDTKALDEQLAKLEEQIIPLK